MTDRTYEAIERELAALIRAGEKIHVHTGPDGRSLDRASFRLLRLLVDRAASGPIRLSCLAGLAGVDVSTVSRQVSHLESAGLAVREPDPEDRRAALLRASEEGTTLLRAIRKARRDRLRGLLATWSPEDRGELARLLGQLNEEVARMTAEETAVPRQMEKTR